MRYRGTHSLSLMVWISGIVLFFLVTPVLIVVAEAFSAGEILTFPPEGLSLKWFVKFFTSSQMMGALWYSLKIAVFSMMVSTVIGTAAALVLVRQSFWGRDFLSAAFMSPLMLPALLTGLGLFQLYMIFGWGQTSVGLLIGHVVVSIPYVIRTVTAMLHNFDTSLEEAARNLGATQAYTFWRVTLPLIKPGIVAGAIFSFITSYDQFTVSLFLVRPGEVTLPIYLFGYLKYSFDPTVAAASTISIALTLTVVLLVERTIGLDAMTGI